MFQVTENVYGFLKYAGRSKAVVIDNRDPLYKGRIRVDHSLIGDSTWIPYLRAPGSFDVPPIGSVVYVEADCGEYTHLVASGNIVNGPDAAPQIPEEFQRDIPTNRGLFTPGGHLLELDDGLANYTNDPKDNSYTTEDRGIRITSSGNNKIHIVEDSSAGQQYILLQDAGGNLVKLDYKNNQLTIHSIGTYNVSTATNKTETVGGADSLSVTGNRTETVGGKLTINVTGNCEITCAQAKVTSSGKTEITAGANCEVTASGMAKVTASEIQLNGPSGKVQTTETDPLVDYITGVPTVGSVTVKAGP